jgi:hypothetical protein
MQATYLKCPRNDKKLSFDEEIVISGMAGRFPKSANVNEFADNLYNKVI